MKVVILCGGLGSRLSEETLIKPKPMVEVGNKPILWHIMNHYSKYGFNEFVLALGYKSEFIKNYFINYKFINSDLNIDLKTGNTIIKNESSENWKIELIHTGDQSMTGGRLLRLKDYLGDQFMLTYGDGLCNVNIKSLVNFHNTHNLSATVTAVRPIARFGGLDIDRNDKVAAFLEKPSVDESNEAWINGGFFVFDHQIFDYLMDDSTILEREPLESLAKNEQLKAFKHYGFWQCMDTIRDRDYLNELAKESSPPWTKDV